MGNSYTRYLTTLMLMALIGSTQLICASASPEPNWEVFYSSMRVTANRASVVVGIHSDTSKTVTVTEWVVFLFKGAISVQTDTIILEYIEIIVVDHMEIVKRVSITITTTIVKVIPERRETRSRTVTQTLRPCVPLGVGTGWTIPPGAEVVEQGYRVVDPPEPEEIKGVPPLVVAVLPGAKNYMEVVITNPTIEAVTVRLNVTGPSGWDYRMEDLLASGDTETIFSIPANTAVIDHLVVTPPTTLAEGTTETVEVTARNEVTGEVLSEHSFLLVYDRQAPNIISSDARLDPTTQLVEASLSVLDAVAVDFFGAELHYSTDNGSTWSSKTMNWAVGNLTGITDFNTTVGPFLYETRLLYYFDVMDVVGNVNSTDVGELTLPSDPLLEENQRLRTEIDALNASYQQLQSDYESLQAQVENLTGELAEAMNSLAASEQTISSLQAQVSNLTATIEDQSETISSQTTQISQLQATLALREDTITSLQGRVSSLEIEMYALLATTIVFLATTAYFARRKPRT